METDSRRFGMIAVVLACGFLAPLAAEDLLQLGQRLYSEGKFTEAEAALRKAPRNNAKARLLLGAALLGQGRREDALAELSAANRLAPGDGEIAKLLGAELLAAGRADEAIHLLTPFARRRPGDEEFQLLAIQAYVARGDLGDMAAAGKLGREALKRFPESPRLLVWRAWSQRDAGDLNGAGRTLEVAVARDTGDVSAWLLLGEVRRLEGNFGTAEKIYRRVLEAGEMLDARIGLGLTLAGKGRLEEAAAEMEMARGAAPRNSRIRLELSRIYARMGRTEDAAREASEFKKLRAGP